MEFHFNLRKLLETNQNERTANENDRSESYIINGDNTFSKNVSSDRTSLSSEESMKQYISQIREKLQEMCDPTKGMSDKDKQNYEKKLRHKIERGEELTAQEMEYIRVHFPELYPDVVRVQIQRKSLEAQLKHCQSKQKVEEVSTMAMLHVSKNDPARQALLAAYENVTEEFKKSDAYKSLPDTDEEAKKLKKSHHKSQQKVSENQDQNQSSDNLELQYFSREKEYTGQLYEA